MVGQRGDPSTGDRFRVECSLSREAAVQRLWCDLSATDSAPSSTWEYGETSVSPENSRFDPIMSFLICCINASACCRIASDDWALCVVIVGDEPLLCSPWSTFVGGANKYSAATSSGHRCWFQITCCRKDSPLVVSGGVGMEFIA